MTSLGQWTKERWIDHGFLEETYKPNEVYFRAANSPAEKSSA